MNRLMMGFIALVIGLANVMAEPQRIEDTETEQPCDNTENSGKPHCNTDTESITVPAAMPNERDSVIVPPDIPAEGMPHQDGSPSSDDSTTNPR